MRDGGLGVVGASLNPSRGFAGRGVTGPLIAAGSRDDGGGVMRAPGRGVARARGIGAERDGGGGVYHWLAGDASFGHPVGSHGINTEVVRW